MYQALQRRLTKACNEIHFDTAECGGIGILRHVKTLRAPCHDAAQIRPAKSRSPPHPAEVGNNARHRFDRIFEQRQTARTRQRSTRRRQVWSMSASPVSASTNSRAVVMRRPRISSSLSVEIRKNARASAIVTGLERRWRHKKHRHGFP